MSLSGGTPAAFTVSRPADRGSGVALVPGEVGHNSPNLTGNVHRSRHALNADTIREMHAAFRRGGREAIDQVMKQQPAVFLKLLVLLVPREMKVEHSGGVKAMTDEQIEQAIEAIQTMLAARADEAAKVIEGTVEPTALPAPEAQSIGAGLEPKRDWFVADPS